jgi:hypothetical protein
MSINGWKSLLVTCALFFAAASPAAPLVATVDGSGPFEAGSTLVVRLTDENPSAMYRADASAYGADLRLTFDTTLIQSPSLTGFLPGVADQDQDFPPMLGPVSSLGGSLAYVDIAFILYDDNGTRLSNNPAELMSLSFTVQAGSGGQGIITVAPYAPTPGEPVSYDFKEARVAFSVAAANSIPEPSNPVLLAITLIIGALVARRQASASSV